MKPISKQLVLLSSVLLLAGCAGGGEEQTNESSTSAEAPVQKAPQDDELALSDLAKKGKVAFLKCRSCHLLNEGDPHLTGPNLHGFYDVEAGTRDGYVYSDALKNSGIVWNAEMLDGWLEKPTQSIPGTKMVFAGLANKAEREALIAYLQEATQ